MKYFNPGTDLSVCKINFVDENNVFVGFDYFGQCCEQFGWHINNPLGETILDECDPIEEVNKELEGWVFDSTYFEETPGTPSNSFHEHNQAIFRLRKEDQELFLTLFNDHNGYYSHGFEMFKEGVTLHNGWL
jgi:hypothetical protein